MAQVEQSKNISLPAIGHEHVEFAIDAEIARLDEMVSRMTPYDAVFFLRGIERHSQSRINEFTED